MARHGEAFKNRAVARLLPPESADVVTVATETVNKRGQTPLFLS